MSLVDESGAPFVREYEAVSGSIGDCGDGTKDARLHLTLNMNFIHLFVGAAIIARRLSKLHATFRAP